MNLSLCCYWRNVESIFQYPQSHSLYEPGKNLKNITWRTAQIITCKIICLKLIIASILNAELQSWCKLVIRTPCTKPLIWSFSLSWWFNEDYPPNNWGPPLFLLLMFYSSKKSNSIISFVLWMAPSMQRFAQKPEFSYATLLYN